MKHVSLFSLLLILGLIATNCTNPKSKETPRQERQEKNAASETTKKDAPFMWENANVYFLLTDRFKNGTTDNDLNFERTNKTGVLRNFTGGDVRGIIQKINEGYFNELGVNAIWLSPVAEQIHGSVDEGTGVTYAYHGYWIKDWTALEPNFATKKDLHELVETAHKHGIRILFDVIINHTGPVTEKDPVWSDSWVRTAPKCTYKDYASAVTCTLTDNLPDIKTESKEEVQLPEALKQKWEKEGRLKQEVAELDEFFAKTGYPRTPRFYIIKWLCDLIREYGIDGFRVDTVKHVEESVWAELWEAASKAYEEWKKENPEKVFHNDDFFMVGELYGYGIGGGRYYTFSNKKVDYFANGFKSLINFQFAGDANKPYEEIFSQYSAVLDSTLKGKGILNYISSHDDGNPFDPERKKAFEAATKLLLCPGAAQIYYGDETNRLLKHEKTVGDARLRTKMNWDELEQNVERNGIKAKEILAHYQKLGKFRQAHPAVGAGVHTMLSKTPYVFKRTYDSDSFVDKVIVGLDLEKGKKEIDIAGLFPDGTNLTDFYSGQKVEVKNGKVNIDSAFNTVLLGE
ncbi:MAG: alpha-amlyase [Bacteroidia bacterium]|nr:MAG: alpha-amlyase [Bacteroidia bacterium]